MQPGKGYGTERKTAMKHLVTLRNGAVVPALGLGTDYLDLYLYHWRGSIPLRETVECLEALQNCGK